MTLSGNYVGADPPDPVLVAPVAAVERVGRLEARVATLETENARLRGERYEPSEDHCPACGHYLPMRIDGTGRVDHECDRTPPLDGLPPTIYVCPVCAGHGRCRYGCWGTRANPHAHAYMEPLHELVRGAR